MQYVSWSFLSFCFNLFCDYFSSLGNFTRGMEPQSSLIWRVMWRLLVKSMFLNSTIDSVFNVYKLFENKEGYMFDICEFHVLDLQNFTLPRRVQKSKSYLPAEKQRRDWQTRRREWQTQRREWQHQRRDWLHQRRGARRRSLRGNQTSLLKTSSESLPTNTIWRWVKLM